jgi:cytochrome c oxidase cbb3-type subunit 3
MTDARRKGPTEGDILDHDYDGIREYDNPMPRWWLNILYLTVLFSVVYALNFIPGVGSGPGRVARYEAEVAEAQEARMAEAKAHPVDAAAIVALTHDATAMAQARERFKAACSPCHREDGGGSIGPNLTDEFWIHGGGAARVVGTVSQGVPAKGMPAWGPVLKPSELSAVAAYVLTLHGTNPKQPKEPQGERYVPSVTDSADAIAGTGGGAPGQGSAARP